ncbi:hypothetical protein P168DRAFT_288227 [Aspergillus campestris IBT 28561]|uniref:Uncharacterized protein n=1 Tax=Aspergillus campestris (strain IBT 28561) TaxID=1392248 RepID=A0A2I1D8T1_ASPC2|nr:uncharacterized protein P168DRAFT_288227 [Aspergillus campestris IBT 28561]PKY06276.1 hypothetical protein P168DRAFT_288227 [Aspergillus campestris IBT 28561]
MMDEHGQTVIVSQSADRTTITLQDISRCGASRSVQPPSHTVLPALPISMPLTFLISS